MANEVDVQTAIEVLLVEGEEEQPAEREGCEGEQPAALAATHATLSLHPSARGTLITIYCSLSELLFIIG